MCQPEGDINREVVAMGKQDTSPTFLDYFLCSVRDKEVVKLVIFTSNIVPVGVISFVLKPRCGRREVKGGQIGDGALAPLI
eukprot:15330530-Ditylum_brightwellii.AAC.1